jgi:hypothetical protein
MTSRTTRRPASFTPAFSSTFRTLLGVVACAAILVSTAPARADVLFYEDFQGYNSFPNQQPDGFPSNQGLPLQSEGAKEYWYGARFQGSDKPSINDALGVQKNGGGTNNTHVGLISDDNGILFHMSTLGLASASLNFDWRTLWTASYDRLRVGIFVGNLNFGNSRFHDFFADSNENFFWSPGWTQILAGNSDAWHHAVAALPLGKADIWVAFWHDGAYCSYGLVDNIKVDCTGPNVPEPSTWAMAIVGGVACGAARLRKYRRK